MTTEAAVTQEMIDFACTIRPQDVCLVPERREEVTTEGGLDAIVQHSRVLETVKRLKDAGIAVSLFLDPNIAQIDAAKQLGADAIELHTGEYANAVGPQVGVELDRLKTAGAVVLLHGLTLHAGHGLTYRNVKPIAALKGMSELNIGHSIVARAIMVGFEQAVREMKRLITEASAGER